MRKLRYTEYENHDCLTSQLQALSDRLKAIEQRLPPEPESPPITPEQLAEYWKKVEGWAAEYRRMWGLPEPEPVSIPSCWTEPLSSCEGVTTTNVPEGEMAVLDMPTGELRWRTQNEDGTWRDCID